jgi:hypothetical protein
MVIHVAMLIISVVLAAAMVLILFLFFRRLNTIQRERWGDRL